MQTPDDERFETYLKQFSPVAAAPLPQESVRNTSLHRFRRAAWFAAAAAVIAGALVLRTKLVRDQVPIPNNASTAAQVPVEPLTLRRANARLASGQTFKTVLDDLAFRPESAPLPEGKQSAVSVLSKEKIKL